MLSCNLVAAVKTAPIIKIIGDDNRGRPMVWQMRWHDEG